MQWIFIKLTLSEADGAPKQFSMKSDGDSYQLTVLSEQIYIREQSLRDGH